jgi:hypothetical protein
MATTILPILGIGMMLIGILFGILYPRRDPRHNRANGVFVMGAVVLLAGWLIKNPSALRETENQLAVALLGVIFAFVQLLGCR